MKDEFFKSKRKATARDIAPCHAAVHARVDCALYGGKNPWLLVDAELPESNLAENWEYYIQPDAEHEDFIHINGPGRKHLCDPACGSGYPGVCVWS